MSAQGQITDFLRTLNGSESGFIPITANQIALQTGIARDVVNKTIYNLLSRHRIEVERGRNGRDIVGLRVIDLEAKRGPAKATPRRLTTRRHPRASYAEPVAVGPATRRSSATPALNEYARAKAHFEQIRTSFGPLIEASFREDPYAEEGLHLRDQLAALQEQFAEVQRERDEYRRDLNALRGRRQQEMAEDAARNGALAQAGD